MNVDVARQVGAVTRGRKCRRQHYALRCTRASGADKGIWRIHELGYGSAVSQRTRWNAAPFATRESFRWRCA